MEKKFYDTFNLGSQSLHYINNENNPGIGTENPPITRIGMEAKKQKHKGCSKNGVQERL